MSEQTQNWSAFQIILPIIGIIIGAIVRPFAKKLADYFWSLIFPRKGIIQICDDNWVTKFEEILPDGHNKGWTKASMSIKQKGQRIKGETVAHKHGVRRWEIVEGKLYNNSYLIAKYRDNENKIIQGIIMLKILSNTKMEGKWVGIDSTTHEIFSGDYIFER